MLLHIVSEPYEVVNGGHRALQVLNEVLAYDVWSLMAATKLNSVILLALIISSLRQGSIHPSLQQQAPARNKTT